MYALTKEQFAEILMERQAPCVSLYMPTARKFPGTEESPRRFKNLLNQAQHSLDANYPATRSDELLHQVRALDTGRDFWNHQWEGLAIFCCPDIFRWLRLPRPVPETVIVANTFHTKPLIRLLQSSDRFNLLCLMQHDVRLYEGDRYGLQPVELRNVPLSDLNRPAIQRPLPNINPDGSAPVAKAGHQPPQGREGTDIEPFARIIDAAVWDQYSRRNGLPLILCADAEVHPMFRRISRNPSLLPEGIKLNPKRLSDDRLRDEAWKVLEPHFRERIDRIIDVYHAAQAHRLASDDLPDVSRAVASGKVGTLLVDGDRQIAAKFDETTGRVEPTATGAADDILDDLAQTVLKRAGQVFVLPHAQMPTQSGVAAIYRY